MKRCAMEVGIPDSYRTVIMYLSRHPGANQKELAEFSDKTTAAINQTVKEMIATGYLHKETDDRDGRYTKLFLTEKGSEKAARLRERLSESDDRITAVIGADKEKELMELLNSLFDVIRRDL